MLTDAVEGTGTHSVVANAEMCHLISFRVIKVRQVPCKNTNFHGTFI